MPMKHFASSSQRCFCGTGDQRHDRACGYAAVLAIARFDGGHYREPRKGKEGHGGAWGSDDPLAVHA